MKRILVTGGSGFLGSHLCKRLLDEGNEVVCLDNLLTSSKCNIFPLMDNKNFHFMLHDIIIPFHVNVDEIYNLACPASPIHYQKNPIRTVKANTIGVINLLELARDVGAKILQASTSEVYGDPEIHPQTESYWGNVNTIGIRSNYDEGKRIAECLMMDYHRTYGVDIRIPRIFNTHGENMATDDGRVISNFIVQALKGKDLTIYGDGTQTRSISYASDTIEGIIRLMNSHYIYPCNIGSIREHTILEIAEIIISLINPSLKIIHEKPLPQDDPRQRKPDISLAKKLLDWEPVVGLEEGLMKTIEYFRSIL